MEFPTPAQCFLDLSRAPGLSSAHFGKRGGALGFLPKLDISIPLNDWLRDLAVPTHKYCGKFEIESYVH